MRSNALLHTREIAQQSAPLAVYGLPSAATLRTRAATLANSFVGMVGVTPDFIDDNIQAWEARGLPGGANDLWPVLRRSVLGDDYEHQLRALMSALRAAEVMKYIWASEQYYVIRPEHTTSLHLHELERIQKGAIIFVPVDTSNRHGGNSVVDARFALRENEFGLGSFELGCALLWQRPLTEQVHYTCIGDTRRVGAGSDTKSAPVFSTENHDPSSRGKICFSHVQIEEPDRRRHSKIITGFAPE